MTEIALHIDRSASGVPLVLLPAFPLDARMWGPVREILDKIPVIAVDPPGFGDRGAPADITYALRAGPHAALETYARAVAAALDDLGVGRIVLAGVSMGGYTAMAFAELFPARLAGIGLLDTSARTDPSDKRQGRLSMVSALEGGQTPDAFTPGLLDSVISPVTKTERGELFELLSSWYAQAPTDGIIWSQRAMAARPGRLDVLESLDVPGLVLRGVDDGLSPFDASEEMAAALGTVVVEVPRAGHLAAVEDPESVAEALRDLWQRATALS
ncbi:MAG TPA: alpha/beta hydrolase [Actinomycetaceae bacterium]|nr:alpha/beta hydrolase [Actinomycetaceae bacterium]